MGALRVGYVGTKGTHLRETRDALQSQNATPANPVVLGGRTSPQTLLRTPSPVRARKALTATTASVFANDAYSHYHSLQTTLSRRWSAGYFQAAYTFSRSTDATSTATPLLTGINDESHVGRLSRFCPTSTAIIVSLSAIATIYPGSGTKKGVKACVAEWVVYQRITCPIRLPFSVLDSGAEARSGTRLCSGVETASLASGASLSSGLTHEALAQGLTLLNPAALLRRRCSTGALRSEPARPTLLQTPTSVQLGSGL